MPKTPIPPDENRIDGVLSLDEARVFRIPRRTLLLVLDDKGGGFDLTGAEVSFSNPVPVRDSLGATIGYATLSQEDGRLYAEASINYHTPERLVLETKTELLYMKPWVVASIDPLETRFVVGDLDMITSKPKTKSLEVLTIYLDRVRPRDLRIPEVMEEIPC